MYPLYWLKVFNSRATAIVGVQGLDFLILLMLTGYNIYISNTQKYKKFRYSHQLVSEKF